MYNFNVVVRHDSSFSPPMVWSGVTVDDDTATYLQTHFNGGEPWVFLLNVALQHVYAELIAHDGPEIAGVIALYNNVGYILIGFPESSWSLTAV